MAGPDVFWIYNYRICLFLYQGLELPEFTCSCTTDPPPLLEAMAGVVRAVLVVKRDNVMAAAIKSSALFEYIVILIIHLLLIGFENATSGF